ncbi:HpcH/HpaI aldolase/citrate lyase family protein [bacterium]|nr:HpcH/HpaI aldolase/citrate lyase family protein [bacterium]
MKKLISNLIKIKKYGVTAVKQSFEDEGAFYDDVQLMRNITYAAKLKLNVKIGGCEAKNDIFFCKKIGVDGIVAPMVETSFAFQKFIECISDINDISLYFNTESKTTLQNLDEILSLTNIKFLKGIVIGRSDLVRSFGHSSEYVDSDDIYEKINIAFKKIKRKKLITKMGGGISPKSITIIKKLYKSKLLDSIETRNIEIELNKNNINNLDHVIGEALIFETKWLEYKYKYYSKIGKEFSDRLEILKKRIK